MKYIYTDGACSGNPGPGGAAFIIIDENENIIYKNGFHFDNTTNNFCELFAIISGCEWAKKNFPLDSFTIKTDSAYCYNCYSQKWYKNWQKNGWKNSKKDPVANKELWELAIPYFEHYNFSFEKVKGHSGNKDWNDFVDKLAVSYRDA